MKELSNHEPDSLERYIEDVADIGPTTQTHKGIIEPKLTEVTISDRARKFDFGNVVYTSNEVFHLQPRIEKGKIHAIKSSPLEQEPHGSRASTIPHHVAENITKCYYKVVSDNLNPCGQHQSHSKI